MQEKTCFCAIMLFWYNNCMTRISIEVSEHTAAGLDAEIGKSEGLYRSKSHLVAIIAQRHAHAFSEAGIRENRGINAIQPDSAEDSEINSNIAPIRGFFGGAPAL